MLGLILTLLKAGYTLDSFPVCCSATQAETHIPLSDNLETNINRANMQTPYKASLQDKCFLK